jgi:hypothetical protein
VTAESIAANAAVIIMGVVPGAVVVMLVLVLVGHH